MYAAYLARPVDLGLVLVYEAPHPSPHLINLGKSIETLLYANIPVLCVKLGRGREKAELVSILSRIGADEIVAGDVYIEDHLRYLESVARDVGASLIEPLWGRDSEELLYEMLEIGFETIVIGCRREMRQWLLKKLDKRNANDFVNSLRNLGFDPLGERGEYHTIVIDSPMHIRRVEIHPVKIEECGAHVLAYVI